MSAAHHEDGGCEVAGSARQENERRTTLAKKCAHAALHIRFGGRRGHGTKIFPKKGRELQEKKREQGGNIRGA